ncbi:MAG TPA: glycosyltransferase [Propionibacteriaceae bacterium]|nr:glycosyltransferase [Propionibacteriaceae bacterium]
MMKVLILHNRYRPAAPSGENLVVDQESDALASAGHHVELLQRHSEEIASWSPLRRATLPAQVLWSERSRRTVSEALADFAPDVVHLHNTFPLLTPSVLYACRDAAVPVVATIHNYKLGCANGSFFRDGRVCHDCLGASRLPAVAHGCYRGSAPATLPIVVGAALHAAAWRRLVSAYIFISAAQRDLLAPLGLPSERSFVKHNFVPAPAETDGAVEHQVAYVGRLDEAKGASFLMRAWDEFRARRPRSLLRLVVVGGGEMAPAVERWAAGHPSVRMAGHVSRPEVSRMLVGPRAVVVPSQWEETFGMVAVEAMAAATAPIASGHGAFPELITPGTDGALFPPTEVGALADLLADVDDEPERWAAYGRQARETYLSRFTVAASTARLLEIYRYAVAHPVGRTDKAAQPLTEPAA